MFCPPHEAVARAVAVAARRHAAGAAPALASRGAHRAVPALELTPGLQVRWGIEAASAAWRAPVATGREARRDCTYRKLVLHCLPEYEPEEPEAEASEARLRKVNSAYAALIEFLRSLGVPQGRSAGAVRETSLLANTGGAAPRGG